MKWDDKDLSLNGTDMNYVGPVYVRPIGRGLVLTGLANEPHLDEVLPEGEYFAEIRVFKWPTKPEDVPSDVLNAGLGIFADFGALALWLNDPASWAGGKVTPSDLIKRGKGGDVVGALRSLAYGNFL